MDTDVPGEAVAIIGMGGRFAKSPDIPALWANLRSGRDCFTRAEDPVVEDVGDDTLRVHSYGLMPHRDRYDTGLVGAAELDPQHGILYESLWQAVEDAGLKFGEINERTAVYAGCARTKHVPRAAFDEVMNIDPTFAGPHFSYLRNLLGESVMIDSACATSAVAVHLACQSLRLHACDYALAGAVAVQEDVQGWYLRPPRSIHATDGISRPFDPRTTGVIPGDGSGAVLLRRLADALRDGDPIHAVIRGSAVGNDGGNKPGFVIPGVDGKVSVVRKALAVAGLSGVDVGYVEAHGVGIPLNDQIEATALTEALGAEGPPVAVGSVKASVGHCDTAAGMAALIKTSLAVREGFLPATPNTRDPIPELTRHGDRFGILPEGRPWDSAGRSRVAGLMSAGVGGTNAFLIVEEPPGV
ncbi:polyketide synthase [Allokutzneria sp. A3M-2-11 16]|uniref:beta-ketoacyl [acyl carrier protein] synthase domain-containing protein n=1 Tax=Allokutzneria sp. A3M-2-11 16 TaxID=2962043 RepID=UPI0020B70311|nr:polyketide synthase [Allokutzneria sp. A3M-2-11 16]MCP3803431.1 polyketide synthase [Allokutzneria sp. A3M-2-11 16]